MFSNLFLKSFRILLLPLALLYWLVISIRNGLYNNNILKSVNFGLPVICVGNLSVGGTGKSPMVEYLVSKLRNQFVMATLSRGYKRKTRGYALANANTTALEIGDEPMQFYLKFPDVAIAVGEQRILAIPQLLHDRPATQAIILDDAFQHRAIRAGLNILLTDYSNLFTRDFYLPTGDLRDIKSSYRRAEILIVTKCKPDLTQIEKQGLIKEINPGANQDIFFTTLVYGEMYHITTKQVFPPDTKTEILLVTGIANPRPLKKMLEEHSNSYHMLHYSDHHIFTIDDLSEIRQKFEKMETSNKIILTTEKDAVRLVKFNNEIAELPVYVIPVRHSFLFQEGERFDNRVSDFIKNFKTTS
ncbi:MAG: tetraacyldisaccharide 4'-kinase [Chitinophagaceae bacterium]